ncbi:MAG: universal stress protein, partial [Aquificaceae bacterium]
STFLSQEEWRDIKRVCLAYDGQDMSKKALNMLKALKTLFGFEINVIHVGEENFQKEMEDVDKYENLKGIPEEKITQYCEEECIDMLVMGAFSKGRLKETVFGSITSFVLHHVNIPILLVK